MNGINEKDGLDFQHFFKVLQKEAHRNAVDKGFYEKEPTYGDHTAFIHREVSEAFESVRNGDPQYKNIPGFTGGEMGLADAAIYMMGVSEHLGYDLAGAIVAKLNYNPTRPYKHGKEF